LDSGGKQAAASAMLSDPILKVLELRRVAVRWLIERIGPSARVVRHGRLRDWIARYGFAELAGITCAFLGSILARRFTGSAVAAAYGAAWGESLGYSGMIITRDFLAESRAARAAERRFGARQASGVVGGLLAEFGPAALLDTFVTRPLVMGLGIRWLGLGLGIVAGKAVADVLFYVPVIFVYERRMRSNRS
jgi:hypothetical protein